jgi:hypothetical protein
MLNCVNFTSGSLCHVWLHNLAHSHSVTCQVISLQIKNMKLSRVISDQISASESRSGIDTVERTDPSRD